jgi:Rrf2 family iron-sulfur cluster assembly transcriptional regulator
MLLGAKSRYAVMAMVDLASRGHQNPVCLAELATAQDIPLPYLEQLFVRLRRAELVQSVRGPGGGYVLAKGADATFIADIVEAVDEPLKMTRCDAEKNAHGCLASKARCMTHDLWDGLGDHIHQYLSGISLEDVCQKKAKQNNVITVSQANSTC